MLSNPELVRNIRAQLRPGKAVTTIVIIGLLSLVAGFAATHIPTPSSGPAGWGFVLLRILFWLQGLVLAAGGGIACVNAIYKEKDHNSFDYQRVTRLSPLELALGKLFGAPIFMYFLCLCFVPLTVFAAIKGRQSASFVLAAYAVLLAGSVLVHAFSLLISLLTVRGSHTTAIIFILVVIWLFSNVFAFTGNYLYLGPLSPFYSSEVVVQTAWSSASLLDGATLLTPQDRYLEAPGATDRFFGHRVQHLPVMLLIDALFIAWFLLALARNIKRDPDQYELYSPLQAFGLTVFINVILLAFVNWHATVIDVQSALLTINVLILSAVGLAQLRNRDRTRRILRAQQGTAIAWIDFAWPAPFLFVAALAACLMIFAGASFPRDPQSEWSPAFSIFRSLFVTVFLLRDMQFLQWMTLRRGKRPLIMGVLYLTVFYVCAFVVLASFGDFFRDPDNRPFTALVLPTPIYSLDHAGWALRPAIWGAAFVVQWILVALLIYAQRGTILELAQSPSAEPALEAAS